MEREPYDPWKVWTWSKPERDAYTARLSAYLDTVDDDPGELDEPPFCTEHRRYDCDCTPQ